MRQFIMLLSLALVCSAHPANGQAPPPAGNEGFIVPGEIVLPVIASQPDCPLRFEEVKHVKFLTGGSGDVYHLVNRGTKSIRAFTVAAVSSNGTGWSSSWSHKSSEKPLLPGETFPRPGEAAEVKIVPRAEKLADALPRAMQGVNVLIVVRVEYTDDSVYENESVYRALQAYFTKIALSLDLKEGRP